MCTLIALGDSHGNINNFRKVVNAIISNENQQSILVHTGDIFDENNNNEYEILFEINRLFNHFINHFITIGNHDDINLFYENFERIPYTKKICNNVKIIVIDSNRHYAQQLSFIENEIKSDEQSRYVILLHHHLIPCSTETSYETIWNRGLNLILREKDLVIHGHSHVFAQYKLQSGTQVLCASLANNKRYYCQRNNLCNCEYSSNLEYLKINLVNDIWQYERIIVE